MLILILNNIFVIVMYLLFFIFINLVSSPNYKFNDFYDYNFFFIIRTCHLDVSVN